MMACIQNLQETNDTLLKNEIEANRQKLKGQQEEAERRENDKRERLRGRR